MDSSSFSPSEAPSHSELGRALGVFDTAALVGPGLPLWPPDGAMIRAELERLALEQTLASG
jgi:threonyl-tRNA synthetase